MIRPVLSVVIPTYNGRALLETCLASIERHRPSRIPTEVIVSDDGSTDGTLEWIHANHPGTLVVRRERNAGFCAAANAGIAAARGAYIQLLNNDTEVCAGWVEAGLEPFADARVGSVAPLVLVRSDPARVDSAGDTYALFGWPAKRGHGQDVRRWESRPPGSVFGASGSSAFYRAAALTRVGAFDPAFGSYYEDVDLAFRLRWAGYDCTFAPRCRILHEISASYDHARPELQRRLARNAEILFWSNLPTPVLLAAIVPHLIFTLAQAVRHLVRRRGKPFLQGKLDALAAMRTLGDRRRSRSELCRGAIGRPHFPFTIAPAADVRNHLRRPNRVA